jgi:tetratricopeptide (TPR) repeat protein
VSSRYVPLLRVVIIVLLVVVVALAGAVLWQSVVGANVDSPRSELERGVAAAEQAVKADPDNPTARVKLAAAYLESKRYGEARDQAEIALRLSPENAAGYYILGLSHVSAGDLDAGIANLEKAVTTEGQLAAFYQDAYVALARAQADNGDLEGAIESMGEALDKGPENALLLHERGTFFERAEMWTDALYDYAFALEYVPDYEPAQEAFDRLAAAHPDALDALKQIATELGSEESTGTATPSTTTQSGSTPTTAGGN